MADAQVHTNEAMSELLQGWQPQTTLGQQVKSGEVASINYVLENGRRILEPEIVDALVPDLEESVILIGGTPGKGGGKRRTVVKKTARMHKSGRRMKNKTMVVVGNRNGIIGLGEADAQDAKDALDKAKRQAKLNIFRVRRGCGSWECGCASHHSIPFKTMGKNSSTRLELLPAPRGIGMAVSDEVKKIIELTGVTDVWMRSIMQSNSRENLIKAVVDALHNLGKIKITGQITEETGMTKGVV